MESPSEKSNFGYTLLEILVILVVVGILAAISAPSWLSLLNRWRLNTAQAEALSVMREAQANARREKRVWQASFREMNAQVQWSLHPPNESETNQIWNNLTREDANKISILDSYTTLQNRNGVYGVQFKHNYWVNGQLGRITFITRGQSNSTNAPKRCVWVSTLLGVLRTDGDRGCQGS